MTRFTRFTPPFLPPLLVALSLSLPAHADEPTPDQACPPPRTLKKCGELGERYYGSSQYALSIQAFRQAFVLEPLPIFLYDMAQGHRVLGQTDEAIRLYERYLREDPATQLKTQVEGYLTELRQKQQDERKARRLAAELEEQQRRAAAASLVVATPPPRPLYKRWWLWTAVGGVVAGAVVVGVVLGTRPGETTLPPINFR